MNLSMHNLIRLSYKFIGFGFKCKYIGSPPDSQRNWDSIDIAERRKQDSSWSASKHKENRILGFEPQDSLTWNNLALQPNIWQQGFGTQMTSGHLETRVPVMFLVPQPSGMVLTNTSLAGGLGQTEPRFDAYKSTQTQFRRYWILNLCTQN